jgi:hypothetical protein
MVSQEDVLVTLVQLHLKMLAAAAFDLGVDEAGQPRHAQRRMMEPYFAEIW